MGSTRTSVVPREESLAHSIRNMVALAVPVIIAELGWMFMGVADTIMVGKLGTEQMGGASVGSIVFMSISIFGMGLMLGLDTLVSQAYGRGRIDDCNHSLRQAVLLAAALTPCIMAGTYLSAWSMPYWGMHPSVLREATPYTNAVVWSTLPLLLYACFRRYLQAMSIVRPVMFALVSANAMNILFNWMLIFGNLGAPAMGVAGAGWATVLSRIYMAGVLFVAIWLRERAEPSGLFDGRLRPDWHRIRALLRLGIPAAWHITLEVGIFGLATVLAGKFTPVALAAHQIALNCASVTFMVPLGISSAGAVMVGQAIGRRDGPGARRSGWIAIGLGAAFMSTMAIVLFTIPRVIVRLYSQDETVIATGASLLFIAAVFQLFDGLQVVTSGVLRGAGDTRTAMITGLIGYWVLALPVGWLLAFQEGLGVYGLWIGLCIGLMIVAVVLVTVWTRTSKKIAAVAMTK
jgi:MATE family multidrug resistance protein